ncbi:hypothetical protein CSKR_108858 [Clonorchis sinensis]|uniref:Uncharacterized protein n=1 Tax=Clonorchis sinensis TaxID=79923 RepID=A0A3R7FQH0_CLOSI|nr:hypothetical protein CSKR_108858 [Clonorchis sinensis]
MYPAETKLNEKKLPLNKRVDKYSQGKQATECFFIKETTRKVAKNSSTAQDRFHPSWGSPVLEANTDETTRNSFHLYFGVLSPQFGCCIVTVGCKTCLTKWGTRISLPTVSSQCDRPPIVNAACIESNRTYSHFTAFASKTVAYTWPKVVLSKLKKTRHPIETDLLAFISVELAQWLRHELAGQKVPGSNPTSET